MKDIYSFRYDVSCLRFLDLTALQTLFQTANICSALYSRKTELVQVGWKLCEIGRACVSEEEQSDILAWERSGTWILRMHFKLLEFFLSEDGREWFETVGLLEEVKRREDKERKENEIAEMEKNTHPVLDKFNDTCEAKDGFKLEEEDKNITVKKIERVPCYNKTKDERALSNLSDIWTGIGLWTGE